MTSRTARSNAPLLASGSTDVRPVNRLLTDFMEYHEGRNPNLFQFALAEAERCRDIESLRRSFPSPVWGGVLGSFAEDATYAVEAVMTE